MTFQVHRNHCIPFGFSHVHKNAVAQNASVVHQNIEITKSFDCSIDETLCALPISNVVVVRHGFATHRNDFVDNLLRRSCIDTGSVVRTTEIVDHNFGAF